MQENCKIYGRFKFDTFFVPINSVLYCLLFAINNLHHTMLSVLPEMEFKEFEPRLKSAKLKRRLKF